MLVENTPVEIHQAGNLRVHVKREDLCCPYPGPSFSKIRGVVAHIKKQEADHIGVLDTFHSKAGWAVSYVCNNLGKTAVNFWPKYKADVVTPENPLPRKQQQMSAAYGAKMVSIKAGRSAILYHTARRYMKEKYPGSYLMPNALKLEESIHETADEVVRSVNNLPKEGVLVISISSGTIASGVLRGFQMAGLLPNYRVILHMGYSRSIDAANTYIRKAAGLELVDFPERSIQYVDQRYGYADAARDVEVPFPCNPYYDAKAWKWLESPEAQEKLRGQNVVFWNIGE